MLVVAAASAVASRFGVSVKLITKIGKDYIGKKVVNKLERDNVELDACSIIKDAITPDFIKVGPSGERTFTIAG